MNPGPARIVWLNYNFYSHYTCNLWGIFTHRYKVHRMGMHGRSWDKNFKTFAPCYSQSPPPADFTFNRLPHGFSWTWDFYSNSWKWVRVGFVYVITLLAQKFSIVLFFITPYFKKHIQIKTTIRNAPKGGKPDRNPYHHYGFRSPHKIINQWRKLKFVHETTFMVKTWEKSQDYAQKPQRNCTSTNSISVVLFDTQTAK